MKKKFTLHLDAILVISLLFIVLVGLVLFQQSEINALSIENKDLQWQALENSLNLDSQASYIKQLQAQLEIKSK